MSKASCWIVLVLAGCSTSPSGTAVGPGADGGTTTPPPNEDGPPKWLDVPGDRLGPLPAQQYAQTAHFASAELCAGCHGSAPGVMQDTKGRDVSPITAYRPSMMALAARDPFYLAAFAHELDAHPAAAATIEKTCTRCHSPAASVETDGRVRFADLTTATTTEAHLARDGVSCTLCHQILSDRLGTRASFTGNFTVGANRQILGPHAGPYALAMETFINYTPVFAPHITRSAVCATCHTVITRALDAKGNASGPEFVEQGAYLEWQNSAFSDESPPRARASGCPTCHVPTSDEEGTAFSAVLSQRPTSGLSTRTPIGLHTLVGGNGYMLRVLAENAQWAGITTPAGEIDEHASKSDAMLARGVKLSIAEAKRSGGGVEILVDVVNGAGHKLPTGYPSRRAWLHVTVRAGGVVVFESGRADAWGRLVDRNDHVLDTDGTILPHKDVVSREDEVQVYESVPVDAAGKPVHALLSATAYGKDNRILPDGYSPLHPNALLTKPVGVKAEDILGSDRVTYRVAQVPAGSLEIEVELLYQSVRPNELTGLAIKPTPAARRLLDMAKKRPPAPVVVGKTTRTVP